MPITQTQRIIDLLLAGHPRDDVASLLGVSPNVVAAAAQDLTSTPSGQGSGFGSGDSTVHGVLTVTGEVAAGTVESEGGIGHFGTEPPGAAAVIAGALSTVADAPAKAVLTSIKNALVATGQATDGTT